MSILTVHKRIQRYQHNCVQDATICLDLHINAILSMFIRCLWVFYLTLKYFCAAVQMLLDYKAIDYKTIVTELDVLELGAVTEFYRNS